MNKRNTRYSPEVRERAVRLVLDQQHRSAGIRGLATLLALACALGFRTAAAAGPDTGSLADLSLEELSNIQITSVRRREESINSVPVAITVLSGDDARRKNIQMASDLQ